MLKKSITELLVDRGIITREELEKERVLAQESKTILEDYLINSKKVEDAVIAKLYSEKLSLPFIEKIDDQSAHAQILLKVPLRFLREHAIIPLKIDNEIVIVTASPTRFQSVDGKR